MIWINYRIWNNFVYLFTTHDISSSQSHHNTSSLYCSADSQRQNKQFVLQSPEKSESGRQYKPFVLQQLTQEHNTNRLYCRRLGGSSYHICDQTLKLKHWPISAKGLVVRMLLWRVVLKGKWTQEQIWNFSNGGYYLKPSPNRNSAI